MKKQKSEQAALERLNALLSVNYLQTMPFGDLLIFINHILNKNHSQEEEEYTKDFSANKRQLYVEIKQILIETDNFDLKQSGSSSGGKIIIAARARLAIVELLEKKAEKDPTIDPTTKQILNLSKDNLEGLRDKANQYSQAKDKSIKELLFIVGGAFAFTGFVFLAGGIGITLIPAIGFLAAGLAAITYGIYKHFSSKKQATEAAKDIDEAKQSFVSPQTNIKAPEESLTFFNRIHAPMPRYKGEKKHKENQAELQGLLQP